MVKRSLTILLLLGTLTACDQVSDFAEGQWSGFKEGLREATSPPREIPRGSKPEVIVKGSDFSFEGQPLRLGDDFESWVEVLGSNYRPSRPDDKYNTLFIWDDLGVWVQLERTRKKVVEGFGIDLNFQQLYEDWNPDSKDYRPGVGNVPAHFFKGYLEVNEVPIDAQSTIREVNQRAKGKLSIHCRRGINICSDRISPAGVPTPYFGVDSRREDSIIYGVDFSMPPDISK